MDERDVVRTVEEENLFHLAFPDIVDLYNKETAEAKDNKLKSKFESHKTNGKLMCNFMH